MDIPMKIPFSFILLLSLITLVAPSAEGNDGENLFQLPNAWYKARFQIAIKKGSGGLLIHLHKSKKDLVGKRLMAKFKLVPPSLNKLISVADTKNPFKEKFPHLYTAGNIQKRLSCPMYGVRLEVDNDTASKEWLLIFSAKKCFEPHYYGTDSSPHQWILQQNKAGHYRILMEAETHFSSLVNTAAEGAYKQIRNSLIIDRTIPESKLQCGEAELVWRYLSKLPSKASSKLPANSSEDNAGQYEIVKKSYVSDQCLSKYPSPKLAKWQEQKHYLDKVKKTVDSWGQRTKRPLIQTRTRPLIQKRPVLERRVFNRQEQQAIDELLK